LLPVAKLIFQQDSSRFVFLFSNFFFLEYRLYALSCQDFDSQFFGGKKTFDNSLGELETETSVRRLQFSVHAMFLKPFWCPEKIDGKVRAILFAAQDNISPIH
jgi:hypothetical protein